jgi:hypothetical protein
MALVRLVWPGRSSIRRISLDGVCERGRGGHKAPSDLHRSRAGFGVLHLSSATGAPAMTAANERSNSALLTDVYLSALRASSGPAKRERLAPTEA